MIWKLPSTSPEQKNSVARSIACRLNSLKSSLHLMHLSRNGFSSLTVSSRLHLTSMHVQSCAYDLLGFRLKTLRPRSLPHCPRPLSSPCVIWRVCAGRRWNLPESCRLWGQVQRSSSHTCTSWGDRGGVSVPTLVQAVPGSQTFKKDFSSLTSPDYRYMSVFLTRLLYGVGW